MAIERYPTTTHGRRRLLRDAVSALAAAPVATGLGTISIATTLAVVISTVSTGRTSSGAPLELICAVLLAAVAAVEGSRPARGVRARRRVTRSMDHGSERR
jgi:hypothetical protein